MRFILSVLMLLASALASVGAVNYPARTNGNNTFYGNISALGRITAGASGNTNSIGDNWSIINNARFTNGTIALPGANGMLMCNSLSGEPLGTSGNILFFGDGLSLYNEFYTVSLDIGATALNASGNFIVNGDMTVTGTIFGMRPFGSLMLVGNENLNLASSGTFYQVVNYDVLSTNYFASSLANGTLTNLVAGYYKIDITCSFDGSGGAADLFESSVFTNTTECATVSFHRKTGSADTGSAASSGILYLPANCRIDARFRNTGATGTIVLRHYNLTVTMQ